MQFGMNLRSETLLLLGRCVARDMFTVADLQSMYSPQVIHQEVQNNFEISAQYPSSVMSDGRFYVSALFETLMVHASHPDSHHYSKENLIAACTMLLLSLRGISQRGGDEGTFVNYLVEEYEKTRQHYMKATMTAEDEFDWFEDLESGIPMHLGSLLKSLNLVFSVTPETGPDVMKQFDEYLQKDPQNPYLYFLKGKAYFLASLSRSGPKFEVECMECIDKALSMVKNDFKFIPLNYFKVLAYVLGANPQNVRERGEKSLKWLEHVENHSHLTPGTVFLSLKASTLAQVGENEKSLSVYSELFDTFFPIDPRSQIAGIAAKSNLLLRMKRYEECVEFLNEVTDRVDSELSGAKGVVLDIVKRCSNFVQQQPEANPSIEEKLRHIQARLSGK